MIKSPNLKQHKNPTISLEQDTISASDAKQNESISQNIPKVTKIPFDTQNPLTSIQVENTKQSQNPISNTLINKSVNNQSKSNKVSTINDDNQVHPNIELPTDPKKDEMKQDTDNPDKSKISIPKSSKYNSSYLQSNEYTDNDNTELQTELKLPTNEEDIMKKSNIESPTQSKSVSIIKDDTINTDVSDSSKLPSLNNQSKSNKELTINHDNQVHLNIKLKTNPKTDKMIQDMDNPDKSKILNSKSPEGNSSYLQLNESTDNYNTEVQNRVKITY